MLKSRFHQPSPHKETHFLGFKRDTCPCFATPLGEWRSWARSPGSGESGVPWDTGTAWGPLCETLWAAPVDGGAVCPPTSQHWAQVHVRVCSSYLTQKCKNQPNKINLYESSFMLTHCVDSQSTPAGLHGFTDFPPKCHPSQIFTKICHPWDLSSQETGFPDNAQS